MEKELGIEEENLWLMNSTLTYLQPTVPHLLVLALATKIAMS